MIDSITVTYRITVTSDGNANNEPVRLLGLAAGCGWMRRKEYTPAK